MDKIQQFLSGRYSTMLYYPFLIFNFLSGFDGGYFQPVIYGDSIKQALNNRPIIGKTFV